LATGGPEYREKGLRRKPMRSSDAFLAARNRSDDASEAFCISGNEVKALQERIAKK
jgi:hypothetical protein